MKIFNQNLNLKLKKVLLRKVENTIGKFRNFPSFSKEWKNTVYFYNKNFLKNIPNDLNTINSIIKTYFNMYFKDNQKMYEMSYRKKLKRWYRKYKSLKILIDRSRKRMNIFEKNLERMKLKVQVWKTIKRNSKYKKMIFQQLKADILDLKKKLKSIQKVKLDKEEKSELLKIQQGELKIKLKKLGNKKRNFIKILSSNTEIKQNNQKAKITFYVINREKTVIMPKYLLLKQVLRKQLIKKLFFKHYRKNLIKMYNLLKKKFKYNYRNYKGQWIESRKFLNYKFKFLNRFIRLQSLYITKMIYTIIYKYAKKRLKILRKYEFKHSLSQFKLNPSIYLSRLSNILNKILVKKLEYNIINLKSIVYNPEIFTKILGSLIRKKKKLYLARDMSSILKKVRLPKVNGIQERTRVEKSIDKIVMKYNDPKLISNLNENINLKNLINNYNQFNDRKKIHQIIYNSIHYKNLGGIRIELKGRLSKRYRADRALYRFRSKGGLRDISSSYQGLSSVLFRGNIKSNVSYSLFKSKRRIGAFAVKGWISGK